MAATPNNGTAALVIAHPGHELCVYGWLEQARPSVFILTDGSGRSGVSRLNSTSRILSAAGAIAGSIYGRFTDQDLYAAILSSNFGLFEQIVAELAEILDQQQVTYVTGDAVEGYNPIHDVCRLVINASVAIVSRSNNREIVNTDFLLLGRHHTRHELPDTFRLTLDDDVFERKLAMARAYPELEAEVDARLNTKTLEQLQAFPELSAEFDSIVMSELGSEVYRMECQRLVSSTSLDGPSRERPFYERYGERLVAAGIYRKAIRYRDHIAPLAEAISRFVDRKSSDPPSLRPVCAASGG
jgi:hypothetical protein